MHNMLWIDRSISTPLKRLVETRPVVLLTGIRQSGKSTLLQTMFPKAEYVTFDHYHHIENATNNPSEFLNSYRNKDQIILDEIQYVPNLFRELKMEIDRNRKKPARWILTGSQKFTLLESVRESLAGRIGLLELDTLGAAELRRHFKPELVQNILWKGGFPETWADPAINITHYLDDYITSYLEKDLRAIIQTPNLRDFHRFMRACALRCGSMINYTDIARDTGISPNTAKSWINVLVRSGTATLLEPYFGNLSKRMAKTPKFFLNDQGLLARLLNMTQENFQNDHPFIGKLWENFVYNELKRSPGISPEKNLYYYRDQNKVEVDFLIEDKQDLHLIEAKFTERPGKTNLPKVAKALERKNVTLSCACRVPSEKPVTGKDYRMINPLLCNEFL